MQNNSLSDRCRLALGAALALGLCAASPLPDAAPAKPPHAATKALRKPVLSDFQVVTWLALTPEAASLIRAPGASAPMDLAARQEDDTYITVYGRKKRPDVGPRPDTGFVPLDSDAAMPQSVRIVPPTHCANGAYSNVGGQPANGADLVGLLGSGAC